MVLGCIARWIAAADVRRLSPHRFFRRRMSLVTSAATKKQWPTSPGMRTVLYSPDKPPLACTSETKRPTRIDVRNETTFQALARLAGSGGGHLACLNFASAKNPGGGFLNGSLAQEEALACASGLYPCLLKAPEYYESNRANRSALYLDLTRFRPLVPFFRNDGGALLEQPVLASVITTPAPNAGAIAQNERA